MPLIKCPECGKDVSDKAPTCPNCAYPLHAQVIEATGKKWKMMQVVGILLMLGGCSTMFDKNMNHGLSAGAFGIGFWLFIGARVGAWWHHG
ncbi:hypothetical protein A2V82_16330 [candidate division KSB1 bacterium RBG_16_48_16]|nr:MAG: hypothetical protein A2V82_16330 [candidate division KSB1 bacterium RBG_16_48_16]